VPAGLVGTIEVPRVDVLQRAVEAVMNREVELGRVPEQVGGATRPAVTSRTSNSGSIWVDVRLHETSQRNLTMTRSEVLYAKNLGHRYRLALVAMDTDGVADVRYLSDPYARVRTDDFHQHAFDLVAGSLWRSAQNPF
jgi:hypothetical protein